MQRSEQAAGPEQITPMPEWQPSQLPLNQGQEPMVSPSEEKRIDNGIEEQSNSTTPPDNSISARHPYLTFLLYMLAAIIMLLWPWIFFGVVSHHGGLELNPKEAHEVEEHRHDTTFVVTTISNLIVTVVGMLFTKAVVNLARQQLVHSKVSVFQLAFLIALGDKKFIRPTPSAIHPLMQHGRWILFALSVFYVAMFQLTTGGINSLLTPGPFNRTVALSGSELDFSSGDPSCIAWFNQFIPPAKCDWTSYKTLNLTSCRTENQLVDTLESGKGSILSLLGPPSIPSTITQLGGVNAGIQTFGSLRGVLPNGPNGVPSLDTLTAFPIPPALFNYPDILDYNYTLNLQGVTSAVSCSYNTGGGPIGFGANPDSRGVFNYSGTCPTGRNLFDGVQLDLLLPANALLFLACQSDNSSSSYTLYLRGTGGYNAIVGNMTCTIEPTQIASFPVVYTGIVDAFTTGQPIKPLQGTSTQLFNLSMQALGDIILEAQDQEANLVTESIITLGVKSFGLPSNGRDDKYLRLHEAMIQGMLEYETTYLRLLYSANVAVQTTPPTTCLRDITGTVSYTTYGWFVAPSVAAFLVPVTIINLTTICLFALAFLISQEDPHNELSDSLALIKLLRLIHTKIGVVKLDDPSSWDVVLVSGDLRNKS